MSFVNGVRRSLLPRISHSPANFHGQRLGESPIPSAAFVGDGKFPPLRSSSPSTLHLPLALAKRSKEFHVFLFCVFSSILKNIFSWSHRSFYDLHVNASSQSLFFAFFLDVLHIKWFMHCSFFPPLFIHWQCVWNLRVLCWVDNV